MNKLMIGFLFPPFKKEAEMIGGGGGGGSLILHRQICVICCPKSLRNLKSESSLCLLVLNVIPWTLNTDKRQFLYSADYSANTSSQSVGM